MHNLRNMKNSGKSHIFLGSPLSCGIDKTVVEAGNSFSPGLWTIGISLAVVKNGELISPDTRDMPMEFENGVPPVVASRYAFDGISINSRLCHIGAKGWHGVDYFEARINGTCDDCAIIARDIGPAGGKISSIKWLEMENALLVNDAIRIEFETPVCNFEILEADTEYDSPMALIHFKDEARIRVIHGYKGRAFHDDCCAGPKIYSVEEGFRQAIRAWQEELPAHVFAPDARIERTWQQCAYHMLAAMDCGVPRISVSNYPVFWMRDCVIVLRALDLIGRSDMARIGCDYMLPLVFSGGFGAESDNPGEGIWALANHAIFTGDKEWAARILSHVLERVRWLDSMMTATDVIFRPSDTRTIWANYWPGSDVVCLRHEGNHIHGRMDGHCPDFYINCWAFAGYDMASRLAELIGDVKLTSEFRDKADALDDEIHSELMPKYGNERDSCATPYPCLALSNNTDELRQLFKEWYVSNRLDASGARVREPLWTYFEAAQMHNAILLGLIDEAWTSLDGFLSDPVWRDMSIYTEGKWNATEMLPFGTGKYGRGWLQEGASGANMPHNWTCSEMTNLIRDMFVRDCDNDVELMCGVPDAWLVPGAEFGVCNMPTRFGMLSYTARVDDAGRIAISFSEGAKIPCHVCGRLEGCVDGL